jgi:hypothetical protein
MNNIQAGVKIKRYSIPAGFPYSFAVKLSRAPVDSDDYSDITDASSVPAAAWALCFCDSTNSAALRIPLDWSLMDNEGWVFITLTAAQTLSLAGRRLRLEVRNDSGTSNLLDYPDTIFYFVPNSLHD